MALRELDEAIRLLQRKIADLFAQVGGLGLPAGMIQPSASINLPAGWLLCDGRAVDRTTYADLYAAIGVRYGAGNGSTTFNLPQLQGRVPVGYSATDTEFNALGKTGGAKTHTLTIAEMPFHSHGVNDPGHSHAQNVTANNGSPGVRRDYASDGASSAFPQGINTNSSTTGITTVGNGGGGAHNNLQPYQTVNYLIKT